MINSFDSTIVALSTATGGALCVVRLSGSHALEIVNKHFGNSLEDRLASFGIFRNEQGEPLDEVVCTFFKAPRSFTGEDLVEISCHGSAFIASEIVRLCVLSGARVATAGEFSKRAFLNGKMDLSQTEAVADMIASSSLESARMALNQMRGGYSAELSGLRGKLLNIKSLLELELDFGDEDVEFASREDLVRLLGELRDRCSSLAESFSVGNAIKSGVAVAIVGRPNVGKSTLLNALVGEQRAIVSSVAGTTRDYIEERVVINGIEFRFVDTAGIRATEDEIEAIGVERSLERMRRSKIVLQLVDSDDYDRVEITEGQELLVVMNKSDLVDNKELALNSVRTTSVTSTFSLVSVSSTLATTSVSSAKDGNGIDICISAKYGICIDELRERLVDLSGLGFISLTQDVVVSNERHWELLSKVVDSAESAIESIELGESGDLVSFRISSALEYLGEITGEFTTDEILGTIFSTFCIGK